MFLSSLRLKKKACFQIYKHRLLAKKSSSVFKRDTDTRGFLVINQSELERNKFGLIAYCFILKAKQIIDEPSIMGTKLV